MLKFSEIVFFLKEKKTNFLKQNMKNPIWNIPVFRNGIWSQTLWPSYSLKGRVSSTVLAQSVCDPAKIFLTSEFSYFTSAQTPPMKLKVRLQKGKRLLITNHLDQSFITIGRSETESSSQITFITLFSQRCTAARLCLLPALVNCTEMLTQNHIVEPNQHVLFWLLLIQFLMDRVIIYWALLGMFLLWVPPIIVCSLEIVVLELFLQFHPHVWYNMSKWTLSLCIDWNPA
jgi:hypothetical protein